MFSAAGRALEDEVRLLSRARGRKRKRKRNEQRGHSCEDDAPKLQEIHSLASIPTFGTPM
jgi:hypothetical protein